MPPSPAPARAIVVLLAFGAGLSAAGLYYNQPMLGLLADAFGASPERIGLVPMLTQLGYASGIIGFSPLGDRFDRRLVILWKSAALVVALLGAAVAPTLFLLLVASYAIGLFASIAQDLVPAAAALAAPEARGRTVGTVMTGLLTGILLSRVVSGVVAERFGWRAMFFAAAASIAVLAVLIARLLPSFPKATRASYGALLASLVSLVRDAPLLRRAALAQGLLSVAFSGFWSTLALALAAPPYGLSSTAAGLFGIAGAAGALAAPLAGGIADRRGPETVIRGGIALVFVAFMGMAAWQGSLWIIALGAVLFDLGVQTSLVAHQTIIYGLDPTARSRINALFITAMFIGMAVGSLVASQALARFGWSGVCVLCASAALAAMVVRLRPG